MCLVSLQEERHQGCVCTEKAVWSYRKEVAIRKPEREHIPRIRSASTLVLDFQLPELLENKFLLKLPSLWYFVRAALAN